MVETNFRETKISNIDEIIRRVNANKEARSAREALAVAGFDFGMDNKRNQQAENLFNLAAQRLGIDTSKMSLEESARIGREVGEIVNYGGYDDTTEAQDRAAAKLIEKLGGNYVPKKDRRAE